MIKELEGKKIFSQEDVVFKKYFCNRKQNDFEEKKLEELSVLINDFCKKVFGKDNFDFSSVIYTVVSYLENYGYYAISDIDRGHMEIFNFGEDLDKAFKNIIINVLFIYSINYEFENRKKLENDFIHRFDNIEYFGCLYFAEDSIKYWNKYYDSNIPDDIINYYENYLNDIYLSKENNISWDFDSDKKLFNCKKQAKVKKLGK